MIVYRIDNPRPPKCVLCDEQVIGRVAVVVTGAAWYEGTPEEPIRRVLVAGDKAHEKCIPMHLRQGSNH